MTIHNDAIRRIAKLFSQGYRSTWHYRPREGECVSYDLFFLGRHQTGIRCLAALALDTDGGVNPIDEALLAGAGPGIAYVYWRPYQEYKSET